MKGNGRILAFFLIVLFIVSLIVLNVTLFTIKEVVVLNKVYSELIDEELIIKSSNIQVGNNIFALSEKKAIKNIEVANPYILVTSIERKFPNKIIIHVTVRTPLMTIGIAESDDYALIDSQLKILGIIDPYSNLYGASTKVKGILIESPAIGSELNKNNPYNAALTAIAYVAENENLSGAAFLTFFNTISFIADKERNNVQIKINSGVTFVLTNNQNLELQLRASLEKYRLTDELSEERKTGYYYFDAEHGWQWTEDIKDLD